MWNICVKMAITIPEWCLYIAYCLLLYCIVSITKLFSSQCKKRREKSSKSSHLMFSVFARKMPEIINELSKWLINVLPIDSPIDRLIVSAPRTNRNVLSGTVLMMVLQFRGTCIFHDLSWLECRCCCEMCPTANQQTHLGCNGEPAHLH